MSRQIQTLGQLQKHVFPKSERHTGSSGMPTSSLPTDLEECCPQYSSCPHDFRLLLRLRHSAASIRDVMLHSTQAGDSHPNRMARMELAGKPPPSLSPFTHMATGQGRRMLTGCYSHTPQVIYQPVRSQSILDRFKHSEKTIYSSLKLLCSLSRRSLSIYPPTGSSTQ